MPHEATRAGSKRVRRSGDEERLFAVSSEVFFGLVGVVVGAVLALGSQYVLERRRERRTIRGVARLMQAELREGLWGVKDIAVAAQTGTELRLISRHVVVDDAVWREHRGSLSEHFPAHELSLLESAQRHRRDFIDLMADRDTNPIRFSEYEWRLLDDFIVESKRAAVLLAQPSGIPWRRRRRMKREFIEYEKLHGRSYPPEDA